MDFLTKEEFEGLDAEARVDALQQLADATGAELEADEGTDLVKLYLDNVPKPDPKPKARSRGGKKVTVIPLDTLRFKDDDGTTLQLPKGLPGEVGPKVAKQLKEEGLVK